ncbi:tetratricopeptide repeat protein [Candidatus Magnetomonas plexicatena]|uniref:tetratricopeptide repeat protein n=1 Tax=Candidatus Magnetomonas plexicatena TaxID=2552947 RepID=UPI001101B22A|nr:tetratricopeptide repeat protein [Nitrospirales bacterium LBB_01]
MLVIFGLIVITVLAYYNLVNNSFVSYDDFKYISENPHIKDGLNLNSLSWSVTATRGSHWHPITWISHMTDVQIFGLNPVGHHLTSLFIHIANSILLFLFLFEITEERLWQSAFVAALFAVHPINVESVVWAAERKNILFMFFMILSWFAYVSYIRSKNIPVYILLLLLSACSVMSKSSAVVLPFTLLLFDFWPLRRYEIGVLHNGVLYQEEKHMVLWLLFEKIPLFLISVAGSVVITLIQEKAHTILSLDELPLANRLSNVVLSYFEYIKNLLNPVDFAVFYPYNDIQSFVPVAAATIFLVGITTLAIAKRNKAPYATMGWLWYVGTFLPVIQIVPVGLARMADRYAYLPEIGIFIVIVWGAGKLLEKTKLQTIATIFICLIVFPPLIFLTHKQTAYWKDSASLFKHAIEITTGNYAAHNNYGQALLKAGRITEARVEFEKGLKIRPYNRELNFNMWLALEMDGKTKDSEKYFLFLKSLGEKSAALNLYKELGIALVKYNRYEPAAKYLSLYVKQNNGDWEVYKNLGVAYGGMKNYDAAISALKRSAKLNPVDWEPHFFNGILLRDSGKRTEAVSEFMSAYRLNPNSKALKDILEHTVDNIGIKP